MSNIDIIIWDLETNGFVAPQSKILEIGAFIVRGEEIEQRNWILDNKVEISPEITAINGITNELIAKEGRDPRECLSEFMELLINAPKNVTHNGVRFDIPFLMAYATDLYNHTDEIKKMTEDIIRSKAYDTAVHCKAKKLKMIPKYGESYIDFADRVMSARIQGIHFNLGLSCSEHKIDTSAVTLHRALGDVAMTYELYKKITQ